MSEELTKDLIEVLKKHNVVDEHSLRDFKIRQRYRELRSVKLDSGKKKYSCKQAREIIADEFYISEKRVQGIVYK
jgi:hypothetical protein